MMAIILFGIWALWCYRWLKGGLIAGYVGFVVLPLTYYFVWVLQQTGPDNGAGWPFFAGLILSLLAAVVPHTIRQHIAPPRIRSRLSPTRHPNISGVTLQRQPDARFNG